MESDSVGLVSKVERLMGLWPARLVLSVVLLMGFVLGCVFLASETTDLAVKWGWDLPSPGFLGGFVVPLVISLGFILLSFACLLSLWRFSSNDALGRRVASLEERVSRIERVLGIDDSDSPFG